MERINTRKRNNQQFSAQIIMITFILFQCLGTIDNSIHFICCRGKAHDDKELGRENSKPPRESRIMTC